MQPSAIFDFRHQKILPGARYLPVCAVLDSSHSSISCFLPGIPFLFVLLRGLAVRSFFSALPVFSVAVRYRYGLAAVLRFLRCQYNSVYTAHSTACGGTFTSDRHFPEALQAHILSLPIPHRTTPYHIRLCNTILNHSIS